MSVQYIQLLQDGIKAISPSCIIDWEGQKIIFLGGLLHLNKIGLTKGLSEVLHGIIPPQSTVPIFSCYFNEVPNIAETATQMHEIEITNGITSQAKEIVDDILLPTEKCILWAQEMEQGDLSRGLESYTKNLKIIGYSYGTSLAQQIEQYAREKIRKYGLPIEVLNNIQCLNVGPVATPMITDIRSGHEVRTDRSYFNDAVFDSSGRFEQVFLFKATDKVMHDVIKDALLSKDRKEYDVFGHGHLLFVCENTGDEMFRRFGVGKFPRGTPDPRIQFNLDHEGHDLRLYTNTLLTKEDENGIFCTVPSSNLGLVAREAITLALWGQKITRLKTVSELKLEMPVSRTYALSSLAERFNSVVRDYRACGFEESVTYLREQAISFVTSPK